MRPQSPADLASQLRAPGLHRKWISLQRVATLLAGFSLLALAATAVMDWKSVARTERTPPAKRLTQDMVAYDLYVRGTYNWNERTRDRLESAISLFNQALARDSSFALPYAALANTYINMSNYGYMPWDSTLPMATAAATRAVKLDPSLAEAHASLGFLFASNGSFEKSEASFRRALQLDPSAASTHHFYSLLLMIEGRRDEAARENHQSLELDPSFPIANTNRGIIMAQQDRFDSARVQLTHSLDLSARNPLAHHFLGAIDAAEEKYAQALLNLEDAYRETPGYPGISGALAYTLRRLHRSAEADSVVHLLHEHNGTNRNQINLAYHEAISGSMDSSFAIFSRVRLDLPTLIGLRADPLLRRLRADARYPRLLASVGLKP